MKIVPLFGTGIRSISDVVTRQRRLNVFYHIREDQDRSAIILHGTPGAQLWVTLPEAPVWGWKVINGVMYVVAGRSLYSVTQPANTYEPPGVYTLLGSIPTAAQYVSITDNSAQILIVDGVAGYIYTFSTGAVTTITDSQFPNGATSADFLDARFICNVPGTREYRISAQLDGSTWSPLVYGTKENSSDLLIAINVLNGAIILWGPQSTEFWQDVATSPNPFQRINGATQSWGLAAINSRAYIGNTMMFLGTNRDNGIQVMKLNGYTPVRVSTSDVENAISNFVTYSDAIALSYMVDGHIMYQLTFPTENRTFCYDDNTSIWHEAQTGVAETARHFGNLGIAYNAHNYISDATTGNLYLVDPDHYTDNDTPIKRQVASRHIRDAGNIVSLAELFLDFEVGVGLTGIDPAVPMLDTVTTEAADDILTEDSFSIIATVAVVQGVNPQAMMRLSRDSGHTFGNEKWVPLGRAGQYMARVMLRRLGSARDFVVQITVTDPVKFVLTSGSAVLETSDD